MADSKITALTALTAADPINDMLPIVDVSDTTMAASGTTKKISVNNILGASGTATLASATITGAATVGTTLGVTGASTLASVGVTGAATVGTTLLVGTNATLTNGNVIIGTSGKGIDFSAVTGGTGTATANVLNDYEEGTWTATLKGATTDPTIAVTATGRYTKVGRQVTVQVYISNVVTTGASGRIGISGLPFANNGSTAAIGTTAFYDMATFTGSLFGELAATGTTVEMYSSVSNSVFQPVTHNAGTGRYLWLNLTYTV